jgi:hypothetical protein
MSRIFNQLKTSRLSVFVIRGARLRRVQKLIAWQALSTLIPIKESTAFFNLTIHPIGGVYGRKEIWANVTERTLIRII